jgi:hypothetical protein
MAYKLVCTAPMHKYKKGQVVTDQVEIKRLQEKHRHHFVQTMIPDGGPAAPVAESDKPAK